MVMTKARNRLARLKPPKAPTKVVEVLTQEEIVRFWAALTPIRLRALEIMLS